MSIDIKKDLIGMQLEQLMTIKKEFLHLQRITSFYSQSDEAPYKSTFKKIEDSIQNYIRYIAKIKQNIDQLYQMNEPYKFLIYHAFVNKWIDEVLKGLGTNNIQIFQEYEEFLDQFVPRPYLSRRYSSKTISIFIENQLNSILKQQDEELHTSIYWGYRNIYKMYPDSEMNEYKIETPFYYHELPYLIPNLFHELNHIVDSCSQESKESGDYLELENKIKYIINSNSGNYVQDDGFYIPEINDGLGEEVAADISACDILGVSYVLAAFHSNISHCMDDVFLDEKNGSLEIEYIDFEGEEFRKDSKLSQDFSKLFEIHLRLWIMCMYVFESEHIDISDEIKEYLLKIMSFLSHIFTVDTEAFDILDNCSLETSYKQYAHTIAPSFIKIHKAFQFLYAKLRVPIREHTRKIIETEFNYERIFNNIWQERIAQEEVVMHRNILRTEILQEIFPKKDGEENA